MSHYYHLCKRHVGRSVTVRTRDGRVYNGRITQVTPTQVYITPVGRQIEGQEEKGKLAKGTDKNVKGQEVLWFGLGWWIPFAAIASLAFLPFFWGPFWW